MTEHAALTWKEKWRATRSAHRAKRAAEALLINQRAALGDTPQEIAQRLEITTKSLRDRSKRWGHALMQRAGFRRLHAWVADRHVTQLDKLAAEAGIPREKALERIIAAAFADGAFVARRIVTPVKSLAERAAA